MSYIGKNIDVIKISVGEEYDCMSSLVISCNQCGNDTISLKKSSSNVMIEIKQGGSISLECKCGNKMKLSLKKT